MAAQHQYLGKTDLLYLCQLMSNEYAKYVEKVSGKQLSTNDFTTELLNKLNGIDTGAQVNVQADFNETNASSDAFIRNKPNLSVYAPLANPAFTGNPTVPTQNEGTSNTSVANTAFVMNAVAKAFSQITGIKFEKVASYADLPATGAAGTIYLVPKTTTSPNNIYTEYYWTGTAYDILGDTAVDLSGYLKTTDVAELSESEVKATWESVFGAS